MKKIESNKVINLIKLQLKIRRKELVGWCMVIFGISFLYTILFPSIQEMAQIKVEMMPKELLQFVGMDSFSDMGNYITYFGIIYGIILIIISIFAIYFSSRTLLDEERTKSIEFLYSREVSKAEIYIAKYTTCFLAIMFVICSSVIATFISGIAAEGKEFDFMTYMQIIKITSLTPFFFMTVSFLLGSISKQFGGTVTGCCILIFLYVLGYLSELIGEEGQWLKYFSPFETLSYENAMNLNSETITWFGIYFGIAIVLSIMGACRYNRRDYQI